VGRERPPPGNTWAGVVGREPHPAHSLQGRIVGANERGGSREEFVQVCGSGRDGTSQGDPICHFLLDGGCEAYAFFVGSPQGDLKMGEQPAASRES
jgi:hypothetical protein